MKWFKHHSNAHKGGVLQDLYAEFGVNEGHGIYFRLVEFLADKWDGNAEPRFRFLTKILQNYLGISPKKFGNFVRILAESENTKAEVSGKFIDIYFPKLLEIRHRDSISSGQRPESGRPNSSGEEKKNKKKSIPENNQLLWFEEISSHYTATFPNTTVGAKALERFTKQIQSEEDLATLRLSLTHYKQSLDYDNRERNWRSPKKSLETFLGTERSGFFWRDHIKEPNLPALKAVAGSGEFTGGWE